MLSVMIIGCGGIAPAHIEGYLHAGRDVKITHLVNLDTERAQALKDQYDLADAQLLTDYHLGLKNADVVSVCTPPATHCAIAVDALNAGCHVLLEKPMATSLAECDQIMAAAKASGKICSTVVQSRYISNIRNVIDMVKSGAYGRNLYTRVNSSWYRSDSYYALNWRGRWMQEGGGCTYIHSIHHIDLLLYAKGMPRSVRAFMTNLAHHNSEEEDFSSSILRYEDGSIAEVSSTLVAHGEPQSLTFQMEKAGLGIPFTAYASTTRSNGFPMPDEAQIQAIETDFHRRPKLPLENHDGQISNFLGAIEDGEALVATAQDGRNCIELITGIYQSAITNQEVCFPIAKDSPYYTSQWRETAPHFNEKQYEVESFADATITNFKGKF